MQAFKYPAHITPPTKLFTPEAARNNLKSRTFSSSASELLTLLPVLGHFFLVVALPEGFCLPEINCFLALVDVVLLVFATDRCKVCPDLLDQMVQRHLTLFMAAYGEELFLPKHHFTTHLGDQLRMFGWLMRCFVHERHHKLLKKYSKNRVNTKSFELGLVEDVTIVQLQALGAEWHAKGMSKPMRPRASTRRTLLEMHPAEPNPTVAHSIRTPRTETITAGDACLFARDGAHNFGELNILYRAGGHDYAIIFEWELCADQPHVDSRRLIARQSPVRIDASSLVLSVTAS